MRISGNVSLSTRLSTGLSGEISSRISGDTFLSERINVLNYNNTYGFLQNINNLGTLPDCSTNIIYLNNNYGKIVKFTIPSGTTLVQVILPPLSEPIPNGTQIGISCSTSTTNTNTSIKIFNSGGNSEALSTFTVNNLSGGSARMLVVINNTWCAMTF